MRSRARPCPADASRQNQVSGKKVESLGSRVQSRKRRSSCPFSPSPSLPLAVSPARTSARSLFPRLAAVRHRLASSVSRRSARRNAPSSGGGRRGRNLLEASRQRIALQSRRQAIPDLWVGQADHSRRDRRPHGIPARQSRQSLWPWRPLPAGREVSLRDTTAGRRHQPGRCVARCDPRDRGIRRFPRVSTAPACPPRRMTDCRDPGNHKQGIANRSIAAGTNGSLQQILGCPSHEASGQQTGHTSGRCHSADLSPQDGSVPDQRLNLALRLPMQPVPGRIPPKALDRPGFGRPLAHHVLIAPPRTSAG